MQKRHYTAEFKKEAAKMLIVEGISVKEVSEQLDVSTKVLYVWRQKYLDEMEANNPEGSVSPKALAAENAELRKQLAKSQRMNAILKKNCRLLQRGGLMQYQFVQNNCSEFTVKELCKCLDVKRSGYYAWQCRAPSAHHIQDKVFKERIRELYEKAKGRYGHRPIYHHLQEEPLSCGRDRVLRLMQELGIAAKQRNGFKPLGTNSRHDFGYSTNLLGQLGQPDRPDQAWVADTTYLRTKSHWCYLATVMDLFSRRIIGWSVSDRNDSELVCRALKGAVLTRAGKVPAGLIHCPSRLTGAPSSHSA